MTIPIFRRLPEFLNVKLAYKNDEGIVERENVITVTHLAIDACNASFKEADVLSEIAALQLHPEHVIPSAIYEYIDDLVMWGLSDHHEDPVAALHLALFGVKSITSYEIAYQTQDSGAVKYMLKIQYQLAPPNAAIHTCITYFDDPAQYE